MAVNEGNDGVRILLAGRAGAYRIFQSLLGNEPDGEILTRLSNEATTEIFELFRTDEASAYGVALSDLQFVTKAALAEGDAFTEKIKGNFTRLFVGPGAVEAPPWESIYLSKEEVLFQGITLDVRRFYVAQGFIPQRYPHVADDHVALELDFMARLAQRLEDVFETRDFHAAIECLSASESFIREHLVNWVPAFAEALKKAQHSYFYREVGGLLAAFLPIDLQVLEEVHGVLKSEIRIVPGEE